MTRSFLIVIGMIIVLGLGLHFHVQWETERFETSLPKPPVSDNTDATEGITKSENAIENSEKFDTKNSEGQRHDNEWYTTLSPSEIVRDTTETQPLSESHSQVVCPNVEVPEPIEDAVAVQLHAEKREIDQLQIEINDKAHRFRKALDTQSISIDEANVIYKELKGKLQHIRELRYQWWLKYGEHPEADVPGHWRNPQIIDRAVASIKEEAEQEVQEEGLSNGYIILPEDP